MKEENKHVASGAGGPAAMPRSRRNRWFVLGAIIVVLAVASLQLFWLDSAKIQSITLPSIKEDPSAQSGISWNGWTAQDGEPFVPSRHLPTEADSLVTLHLSSFDYGKWSDAVFSRQSSSDFLQTLNELLKNPNRPGAIFTVLFLTDPLFFDTPGNSGIRRLPVDLDRVRKFLSAGPSPAVHPFQAMALKEDTSFILGQVSMSLHTTKREGATAIGISIWQGMRPIDEISVPVCIGAATCAPVPALQSLKGSDSLRVSLTASADPHTYPDAALHFIDLDIGKSVGVFHLKEWPDTKFVTWRLNDSPAALRDWLKDSLIPAFRNIAKPAELADRGRGLFERLFPDGPEAAGARKQFIEFFRKERFSAKAGQQNPSSIFVRMLPQVADPLPIFPAGLLAVPLSADDSELGFLGLEFRVESPLEFQDYSAPAACASNWVMLLPPDGSEWSETRARLGGDLVRWQSTRNVFDSIPAFRDWMKLSDALPASTVIATLSHHDRDRLYFYPAENMMSTGIRRHFANPSVAILDGCGTGNIGAVDMVRALNRQGVNTVIATSTEIRTSLAADFLSVLDQTIAAQPGAEMPSALALFKTMRTLSKKRASKTDGEYGPLVLAYSLLGNGNTRLCASQKKEQ